MTTAEWALMLGAVLPIVVFAALLFRFGEGPDHAVNSRRQPRLFWGLCYLLLFSLCAALAGLGMAFR